MCSAPSVQRARGEAERRAHANEVCVSSSSLAIRVSSRFSQNSQDPEIKGSSPAHSMFLPHLGSRTMPTLGDQQSRPRCGSCVGGWFSPLP